MAHVHFGEHAYFLERHGPRAIDRELIRQQATVERKRSLERVELRVRLALEAASPQAIVFAFGHWHLGSRPARIQSLPPSALALGRTVTGSANRLMKPSASLGLYRPMVKLARSVRYNENGETRFVTLRLPFHNFNPTVPVTFCCEALKNPSRAARSGENHSP